jgi:hypothetical protein
MMYVKKSENSLFVSQEWREASKWEVVKVENQSYAQSLTENF